VDVEESSWIRHGRSQRVENIVVASLADVGHGLERQRHRARIRKRVQNGLNYGRA
jgi:hypothetical protein